VTWFLLYAVAVLGLAGSAIVVHRDRAKTRLGRGAPVLVAFAMATAGAIAVHVMVPSLGHAMSPRYLALTWSFGVLVLAWVADLWEVPTAYWVVSLFAVPLVVASVYIVGIAPRKAAPPIAGSARHVVVDNLARGVLLPYVHQTGPDTLVYAQSRTELLEAPEEWLERLGPGDLVVLIDMYGNKKDEKPKLLSLVEERWTLRAERAEGLRGTAYRVLAAR
ncbi:MAG: hypothetical protein HY876_07600, partial [Coriobacteriales bacterium]|nr:hypothetical protein [Coriobacteriales bacterium]